MKTYRMTAEQKAQAEARKAQFAKVCTKVGEMTDEQRAEMAARFPIMRADGFPVSARNAVLLASQRDNVTIVAGFRQWQALGRNVCKGETGLKMFAPRSPSKAEEAQTVADVPADVLTLSVESVYFIVVTVFDISQTVEMTGETKSETAEAENA